MHQSKILAAIAVMVVVCLIAPSAQAHSVRARELEATIRTVRVETRTLVVISAKEKFPREMVWNRSTSFVENRQFVDAAKLREGIKVRVYYHSPFFGRPYLTKVAWNTTATQTK
jgi:hypothetical protein